MESIFNSDLLKELISTALLAFIVWSIYKRHVSDFDQKYSTFWPRFWAPAVDELILWPLVTLLPLLIVEYFGNNGLQAEVIIGGAILFHYVYSITLHTHKGATIGKQVCKVRVVDAKTECPITFKQALLRDAIPAVLIVCLLTAGTFSTITGDESLIFWVFAVLATWFLLELITMLFNKKRRALHDFIAGTVVVRSDLWEADCARRKQMSQERTFG